MKTAVIQFDGVQADYKMIVALWSTSKKSLTGLSTFSFSGEDYLLVEPSKNLSSYLSSSLIKDKLIYQQKTAKTLIMSKNRYSLVFNNYHPNKKIVKYKFQDCFTKKTRTSNSEKLKKTKDSFLIISYLQKYRKTSSILMAVFFLLPIMTKFIIWLFNHL